jgi:hypothetical protein
LTLPMRAGRPFTAADYDVATAYALAAVARRDAKPGAPAVQDPAVPLPVIVNQMFVSEVFGGVNPLGKRFGVEAVGVSDARRKPATKSSESCRTRSLAICGEIAPITYLRAAARLRRSKCGPPAIRGRQSRRFAI